MVALNNPRNERRLEYGIGYKLLVITYQIISIILSMIIVVSIISYDSNYLLKIALIALTIGSILTCISLILMETYQDALYAIYKADFELLIPDTTNNHPCIEGAIFMFLIGFMFKFLGTIVFLVCTISNYCPMNTFKLWALIRFGIHIATNTLFVLIFLYRYYTTRIPVMFGIYN